MIRVDDQAHEVVAGRRYVGRRVRLWDEEQHATVTDHCLRAYGDDEQSVGTLDVLEQ
jgi:hypothetical protein